MTIELDGVGQWSRALTLYFDVYRLEGDDITEKCTKNAAAAAAVGRRDLVQVRPSFVYLEPS